MTGEKTVIFGHTPTCNINGTWHPFITDGCIGIDTGCVYGGCLSALELNDGVLQAVHQVSKHAA